MSSPGLKEHKLFEPIDIAYLDSNMHYHPGVKKLYIEYDFITTDKNRIKKLKLDTNDKFDYYWKYKKIGLTNFKFEEDINDTMV